MLRTHFLGIDLHKKNLVWSLLDEHGTELQCETVRSHPEHISTALLQLSVRTEYITAVIEPTCGWRWVSKLLEEHGCAVKYAHPLKVRMIADSTEKTDRRDAFTLANLLRTGYLPEAYRAPDDIYELRTLVRERTSIVRARADAYNRLHGIATTQGIHAIPKHNPRSQSGMTYIQNSDNVVLKEILTLTEVLTERIAVYDQLLKEASDKHSDIKRLMSMPGIGIITATTVVAEVGDFSRFATAKQLAKYAGLVPKQRSSGERIRHGGITRAGSSILRSTMVEAAMRIHAKGAPELYGFVARLNKTTGKKPSRVALARKLLTLMWHLVMKDTTYDSTLVRCGMSVQTTL